LPWHARGGMRLSELAGGTEQGKTMKQFRMLAALAVAIALAGSPMTLLARTHSGGSSSRVHYSGSHHSESHRGHYSSGQGPSHRGGSYRNTRTANHYGQHKH
jgi:hypothetical protein